MTPETFHYTDKDGNKVPLNWDLAIRQGCSAFDIEDIISTHRMRVSVFMDMEAMREDDVEELRTGANVVEQLEFHLQRLWHFKEDKNYHSWWFKVPHCRCPKLDNADPMYFGHRIFVEGCPIHWRDDEYGE